jgi:hypothetical protein
VAQMIAHQLQIEYDPLPPAGDVLAAVKAAPFIPTATVSTLRRAIGVSRGGCEHRRALVAVKSQGDTKGAPPAAARGIPRTPVSDQPPFGVGDEAARTESRQQHA